MPNDEVPKRLDVMKRQGLRFRILYEYYIMLHRGENPLRPNNKPPYKNAEIGKPEINAAEKYLIDRGLLEGNIENYSGELLMIISGISYVGVDLVEQVVLESKNKELREAVDEKSIEKVERLIKKCFNHPAAGSICKTTVDAIVRLLGSSQQL